ncbi:MAG: Nif3-like dinuclear metal center hexameric protein [Flavobacteriales bacterium]
MKIHQITSYLEQIAPLSYQESYDNSGLIVGDRNAEIAKVLLCLDSLESIIDEAIEKGCELVIAHHPIVFSGLKSLTGKNYIEKTILKAIKNDIAIYACHTNLDNVLKNGVNQKMADSLGLVNTKILAPKSGMMSKLVVYCRPNNAKAVRNNLFENGAGNISEYSECSFNTEGKGTYLPSQNSNPAFGEKGELSTENEIKIEVLAVNHQISKLLTEVKKVHEYEEVAHEIIPIANANQQIGSGMIGELETEIDALDFLKSLKAKMKTDCVRHTNLNKKAVKKIAICGGSGSFLLNDAITQQTDVFITGDYKYHQFFDAEDKIIIADIGHFESEQFTIDLFHDILSPQFSGVQFIRTEINTNPVKYL